MNIDSTKPESLSSFLDAYSPDSFEWESPGYCPRTRFLWSKPLSIAPHGSPSKSSTRHETVQCDGPLSPGFESLSDMSISFPDIGYSHANYFAVLPPMIRLRAAPNVTALPAITGSDSSSLSDMSISFSTASSSSLTLEDFEKFAANMPSQTLRRPLLQDDLLSSPSLASGYNAGIPYARYDPDAAAVSKILDWISSLFADVANSVLDYSIRPGSHDLPWPSHFDGCDSCGACEDELVDCQPTSKETISESLSSFAIPVVKLKTCGQIGPRRPILADPQSVLMSGSIDYEDIDPEQPATSKAVCMWGRRLERIPKVRLAGQKEAVYCFDARKQRQKYKTSRNPVERPANSGPRNEQQPTQIFYRARPLCSPFVRRDLPATPIDAIKIAQGQVLLQNVNPVRFDSALSPVCTSSVGAQHPTQRFPLSTRTNDFAQNRHSASECSSTNLAKIRQSGFL
ncbi:uncharacterized protein FOMMEDRAFT_157855 [Fomitiporia mediterranea MF3/22]|uniref:uncharacterized protein n=1 Tax=Fomitiporia mediterranea (strain MF3/22) TaxID=694068 RepID=UPI0004407BC0|nr:uncharacterized protein FOMMEDRAFT_157855 [Fomitiporia mediterranea MF3/22]EJD00750.1 hypothetical protein FOMMEDRAFT_157855 [Fomitiporia mediterranea MF3/22]